MIIKDVAKDLSQKYGCPCKLTEDVIYGFIEAIRRETNDTGKALVFGLGTFKIVEKAERNGVNPKTQEKIVIPARKAVKFSAAKHFVKESK